MKPLTRYNSRLSRAAAPAFGAVIVALSALAVFGQAAGEGVPKVGAPPVVTGPARIGPPRPSVPGAPREPVVAVWKAAAAAHGVPLEKAIAVQPGVYISVCVRRGAVRINGWERNEVRAFNRGGRDLGFKVIERGGKDKLPAWVEVLGFEPDTTRGEADKCITGEMIELDVPVGAAVAIKGLSSETSVDSVKRASVEIVGGDIYLNKIAGSIDASTQQGGVTVNNSTGRMAVSTTTGNIVAYNTEAVDIGDYFKAKTRSGAVTLQSIGQKEVAASTISGTISYLGDIMNYGKYEFSTTNGLINLVIPDSSSFWFSAVYGGRFISEFPFELIQEDESETAFRVTGRVGSGGANLRLNSYSGTIRIRKREMPETEETEVRIP